jgi:hypothetical protein
MGTRQFGAVVPVVLLLAAGGLTGCKAGTQPGAEKPAQTGTDNKAPAAQGTAKAAERDSIKVSDDAFRVLRDVHAARLEIFDGLPGAAKKDVASAVNDIAATEKMAAQYAVDLKKPMKEGDMYVPFDVQLAISDSFVASPEKNKHIAEANEHLKKGNKKEAISVLKLADIEVVYSAALIPVKLSQQRIKDASRLIDEGKYYEANLALKAVEDSILVDTFGVDEVPTAKKADEAEKKK